MWYVLATYSYTTMSIVTKKCGYIKTNVGLLKWVLVKLTECH